MSNNEFARTSDAIREYVRVVGAESPDSPWIVSPYDTWERNPHYQGPAVPHPDDFDDEEAPAFFINPAPTPVPSTDYPVPAGLIFDPFDNGIDF